MVTPCSKCVGMEPWPSRAVGEGQLEPGVAKPAGRWLCTGAVPGSSSTPASLAGLKKTFLPWTKGEPSVAVYGAPLLLFRTWLTNEK